VIIHLFAQLGLGSVKQAAVDDGRLLSGQNLAPKAFNAGQRKYKLILMGFIETARGGNGGDGGI
jgi:hypothetical protein